MTQSARVEVIFGGQQSPRFWRESGQVRRSTQKVRYDTDTRRADRPRRGICSVSGIEKNVEIVARTVWESANRGVEDKRVASRRQIMTGVGDEVGVILFTRGVIVKVGGGALSPATRHGCVLMCEVQ